ncbi:hypothetical protein RB195_020500 [Necator americanus]|uniref:Tyrosine specific protein phosphatases domain-containing protein n=1 Tax=Necator americanus TaxID=51031 RepID=A0ABR1CL92_NECAM
MLASFAFYPSLGYNLLRNYLQPHKWTWYNRVDDNLIVGALPFKSMQDELINKENVGGVVCCVEDYELKLAYNAIQKEDWRAAGVEVHDIPMTDFFGSTGRAQIDSAVHFMEGVAAKGKSVYVHCKAGRTRSATVAASNVLRQYCGMHIGGLPTNIVVFWIGMCQVVKQLRRLHHLKKCSPDVGRTASIAVPDFSARLW